LINIIFNEEARHNRRNQFHARAIIVFRTMPFVLSILILTESNLFVNVYASSRTVNAELQKKCVNDTTYFDFLLESSR